MVDDVFLSPRNRRVDLVINRGCNPLSGTPHPPSGAPSFQPRHGVELGPRSQLGTVVPLQGWSWIMEPIHREKKCHGDHRSVWWKNHGFGRMVGLWTLEGVFPKNLPWEFLANRNRLGFSQLDCFTKIFFFFSGWLVLVLKTCLLMFLRMMIGVAFLQSCKYWNFASHDFFSH